MAGKQKLSRFSYVIFNLVAKLSEASSRPAHLFWLPISCNMAISFYISVEAAPHSMCYKTILHDFTVCHFQDMTLYSNATTWSNDRALLGCATTISDGHRVLTSIKDHLKTSKNWFKRFRTCWLHKLCRCTCTSSSWICTILAERYTMYSIYYHVYTIHFHANILNVQKISMITCQFSAHSVHSFLSFSNILSPKIDIKALNLSITYRTHTNGTVEVK